MAINAVSGVLVLHCSGFQVVRYTYSQYIESVSSFPADNQICISREIGRVSLILNFWSEAEKEIFFKDS